jgi:hypothetical protein
MTQKKRPRDLNQLAAQISGIATGQTGPEPKPVSGVSKDPAAVALGRKGGKKGGKARADKLTLEERQKIARIAAQARWKKTSD